MQHVGRVNKWQLIYFIYFYFTQKEMIMEYGINMAFDELITEDDQGNDIVKI